MTAGSTARRAVPLSRRLSRPLTRLLLPLPVSANGVTLASAGVGLVALFIFTRGAWGWDVFAALLFVFSYLLDFSDGDIARARGTASFFGRMLDSFVDWLVNSGFFFCLGIGVGTARHEPLWLWLGLAAAVGSTINYGIALSRALAERRAGRSREAPPPEESEQPLAGWKDHLLYGFRELARSDFCFLVLLLALADSLWLLLPAGALGAQAYWIAALYERRRS